MDSTVLLEFVWTPGFPGLSVETIIVEHTLVLWNALRHKQYMFRRNLCAIYPSCIPSDI